MIGRVVIAGADHSLLEVLADVTIRHGRESAFGPMNASAASLTLINCPRSLPQSCGVGNSLRLETPTGEPRFVGTVTDAAAEFPDPHEGATVRIVAIGNLALLGRAFVGLTAWPEEAASDRIARILSEAAPVAPVQSVLDLPPDHDYTVAARPAGAITALTALTDTALSTGAVVSDLPTGEIMIQSLRVRGSGASFAISADRVAYAPTWRQSLDVTNRVTVKFDGGEVVADDADSIAEFGLREGTLETSLVDSALARSRGLDYLMRRSVPRWEIGDVTTNLTAAEFSSPVPGSLVYLAADHPHGLPIAGHPSVLEGWEERQVGRIWNARLNLSDGVMSYSTLKWDGIPPADPAYRWNTIRPTTAWEDALLLPDLRN